MKLDELRPGDVFRTEGAPIAVRWEPAYAVGGLLHVGCLALDGTGYTFAPLGDTPVEPLDLPALLAERDELSAVVHDLLIDSVAFEYGRQAERGEVVRLLEDVARACQGRKMRLRTSGDSANRAAAVREGYREEGVWEAREAVSARGPAATLLPPARLAKRVQELEAALRELLADAEEAEEYWHGTDPAKMPPSFLAARAALGTK
jgi:hypothetical protein